MPSDITLDPDRSSRLARLGDAADPAPEPAAPSVIPPPTQSGESALHQAVESSIDFSTVRAADVVQRVLVRRLKVKPEKLVDVALAVLQGRGYLSGARAGPPGDVDLVARLRAALGGRPARMVEGDVIEAEIGANTMNAQGDQADS